MVIFVETGDFRSPRVDTIDDERGKFTVQCTDVPLAALRRKPNQKKAMKKNVRLTPIHEELDRENSLYCANDERGTDVRSTSSTLSEEDISISSSRSATPAGLRRPENINKILNDVADAYERELENLLEDSNTDPRVKQFVRDLPPRPKGRRKVLPPTVTRLNEHDEPKKVRLVKRRSKISLDRVASVPPPKDEKSITMNIKHPLGDLKSDRPKSAGSGVRVIRLGDLSSVNSTSVPDLPSIISKLSHVCDDNAREVSEYDDSGALSTPRKSADKPTVPLDSSILRGNEISSFYNMWERDRKRRPFDKKASKGPGLSVNRDCMCAIRQYGLKKCGHIHKRHFLPPLH